MVVLAGGYGGAKLSHGMALASATRAAQGDDELTLTIIVNTGDDLELHGLDDLEAVQLRHVSVHGDGVPRP